METKPANDDAESSALPAKKAYKSPVLLAWGTLKDITGARSGSRSSDGGKGAKSHTS